MSYRTLSFSYDEEDISIGGEGHEGLTLRRSYSSSPPSNPGVFAALGWTENFASYLSFEEIPYFPGYEPYPYERQWIYHVSIGMKSYAFIGGTTGGDINSAWHGPWGDYVSVSPNGVTLVYNGGENDYSNTFTLTEADGTVTNFSSGLSNAKMLNIIYPDGTRLDFTYTYTTNGPLESVFSNRGWAILFDSKTTACVVNRAMTYVTAMSSCPLGARSVTYGYSTIGTFGPNLTSVTKDGATATYGYNSIARLNCVRDPGQSECRISNTYGECPTVTGDTFYNNVVRHGLAPVISQQTATGETYAYAPTTAHCRQPDPEFNYPWVANSVAMTVNGTQTTTVGVNTSGVPSWITDPLSRTTTVYYEGGYDQAEPWRIIYPELDEARYVRDGRGNILQWTRKAKPGSGLADIVSSAAYPSTCANRRTCNKPTSVTDANGNITSFTYDAAHGGVLTETAPAVGGISPVKRYAYTQHYAWLKASGSGHAQAATPIWLVSEVRTCMTSATVGNACGAGSSDEVVTSYTYEAGNGATPSNLLLKGVVVTSNGTSLRTCYGYDGDGRRISETTPNANLGACP